MLTLLLLIPSFLSRKTYTKKEKEDWRIYWDWVSEGMIPEGEHIEVTLYVGNKKLGAYGLVDMGSVYNLVTVAGQHVNGRTILVNGIVSAITTNLRNGDIVRIVS
jgi:hypothetical protein